MLKKFTPWLLWTLLAPCYILAAEPVDSLIAKLPAGESVVRLFNGRDLEGWDGAPGIWSVEDGVIKGANAGPVPTSTYLFTNKSYRNFRLIFEVKQTISPAHSGMHSAVAALAACRL